jgi:hypothetical protein
VVRKIRQMARLCGPSIQLWTLTLLLRAIVIAAASLPDGLCDISPRALHKWLRHGILTDVTSKETLTTAGIKPNQHPKSA